MTRSDWQSQFHSELEQAEAARLAGNEGKARVCARRAVGVLIGEYLEYCGLAPPGSSAPELLKVLQALPDLPLPVREVAGHFLVRVNPDHNLPIDVDLIQEARWLASELLGEDH